MPWNWKKKGWPHFKYDLTRFASFEKKYLHNSGLLDGSLKHLDSQEDESLKLELLIDEALYTSEIEGEILNRDSLKSSIRKHLGLKTDMKRVPPAEEGIADMMVSLYKTYEKPLTHEMMFEWHKMLTLGRRDLIDIGAYRTHEDSMQVVSGSINKPKVHFEAPPSERVPKEMEEFVGWFNRMSTSEEAGLYPLVFSGIAHLYFESIHPFEDGNGRIGRALSIKAISQQMGKPALLAFSKVIQQNKKDYYEALNKNSFDLNINPWLEYYAQTVLKAQEYTQKLIDFLIEKTKLYQKFDKHLNERQAKVIDRVFREGLEGFKGGLSAANYIRIAQTTASTATRDLQSLVEMGALKRTGERKATRYYLSLEINK
ncbi:Fic family protein [Roseivirga sp. UBA838]|uniref:Fic family protein n=1 Tax=Roseivirga sp. UBA838 TaxID=1947393 RepID=UPI00257988D9|nr:Fic family protein [Roseivirga sp. UBA838]|tara:strand:+ start:21892 stop:23004 length:1113 start_codon:yes stop_codon:yes gene_type:complete